MPLGGGAFHRGTTPPSRLPLEIFLQAPMYVLVGWKMLLALYLYSCNSARTKASIGCKAGIEKNKYAENIGTSCDGDDIVLLEPSVFRRSNTISTVGAAGDGRREYHRSRETSLEL